MDFILTVGLVVIIGALFEIAVLLMTSNRHGEESNRLNKESNNLKKLELKKQGVSAREIHEATYGK